MLIPFLYLSIYALPIGDDFWYYNLSNEMGYFESQKFYYNHINARYLSTAIATIPIWLENDFIFYKFLSFTIFFLFYISLNSLVTRVLIIEEKRANYVISLIIFIGFLLISPNISSSFYWLSGIVTYQISNILFIMLLNYSFRVYTESKKNLNGLICFIIIISIGGMNELNLMFSLLLFVAILFHSYFFIKKIDNWSIFLSVTSFVLILISFLSKGTSSRLVGKQEINVFDMILNTFSDIKIYIIKWLPIVLLLSFFILYILKINNYPKKRTKLFEINSWFIFTIVMVSLFIAFFLGNYSLGKTLPSRALNVVGLFCFFGFLFLIISLYYKYSFEKKILIYFSKPLMIIMTILIFCSIAEKSNIKTAISDVVFSKASTYNKILKNRHHRIIDSNQDTVYVKEIKTIPKTIFVGDITNNSLDWRNVAYNTFYNKIILLKQ